MTIEKPVIRGVALDLDGTMFNSEELYDIIGSTLLERRSAVPTRELKLAMMGRPGPVALQIMIDWHQLDVTVDQLVAETDELIHGLLPLHLKPMPGLHELLGTLARRGTPTGIATSGSRDYLTQVLEISQLAGQFAFELTSDDVRQCKPHPEIYLRACQLMELPAQQVLVLEDSPIGCQAAVAARTVAVAIPSAPSPYERHIEFPGAHFIADSLADPRIYELLA